MPALRRSVVDGLFYAAAPAALRAQVADYLAAAGADDNDAARTAPKLLITPHAAYEYCGAVAASAYARLRGQRARSISRIVLLGPAHRVAVQGLAAPRVTAFEAPLGEVALDVAALARLDGLPQVVRDDRAHDREHSLEVHLPLLQMLLGEFSLVPLLVGGAGAEAVAQVLERLWGGDETLIVISSDLSHYLPYEQAQAADRATVQRILQLDAGSGLNDSSAEIDAMARWIADHLGLDVPLHFTAFRPDYKMLDRPPTPPATLTRARAIALGNGLHHVYTGNVHDIEGGTTFCPGCHAALIERDWCQVLRCDLDTSGACPHCGAAIAGRFGGFKRGFGRRRIAVRLEAA